MYPLPDQIADKVAAMVERHGPRDRASTRYRDLVDLVLIVRSCEVDAALTRAALSAQAHRRELTLPLTLSAPSPAWVPGYRKAVGDAGGRGVPRGRIRRIRGVRCRAPAQAPATPLRVVVGGAGGGVAAGRFFGAGGSWR